MTILGEWAGIDIHLVTVSIFTRIAGKIGIFVISQQV